MQLAMHMVTIEDLMPREHFLRKLEAALDLSFVYEETAPLYSKKYGRPAIDPVVIVKYLLVGFLYGIPSERQIERRVQTDIALRWYLGLDLFDRVPDHSTVSQLRRRKPSFRKVFRRLFEEVVLYALLLDRASISRQNGYVEPDGTIRLYFTLEQAQTKLHRSRQSATRIFRELEYSGLIVRRKRGLGKPALITLNYPADAKLIVKEEVPDAQT